MPTLAAFVRRLVRDGRVALRQRPLAMAGEAAEAVAVLEKAHAVDALDLAGPPPPFVPAVALAAAELVRQACWFLVSRDEGRDELDRALELPRPLPRDPGHASADLSLRYLPGLLRRARAIDPGDPLADRLATVLRGWPLSGVLADLDGPPDLAPDWSPSAGLAWRYAERLAAVDRPEWLPVDPEGRAAVAWVVGRRAPGSPRLAEALAAVGGGPALGR